MTCEIVIIKIRIEYGERHGRLLRKKLSVALKLDDTSKILDTTLKIGQEAGMLPLTVVVLDAGRPPISHEA
ncbi:hypothetical protein [Marinomonas ushuaiensis]|uniref:hypothetical protein n=1 Tax=Marinomonas ushuaiensis TaxID=263818 RepID=UPI001FDEFFFA|nr:hypothetical protein [Marinomonas ushuaiensis]